MKEAQQEKILNNIHNPHDLLVYAFEKMVCNTVEYSELKNCSKTRVEYMISQCELLVRGFRKFNIQPSAMNLLAKNIFTEHNYDVRHFINS